MPKSHISPVSVGLLLVWLTSTGHCQYDPYGGPPYYGEAQPFPPNFPPPEGPFLPQTWSPQPQLYPPVNTNPNFINPFLLAANQGQGTQQQKQLQQVQGSYPNLPSVPFKTVSPNNAANRYPFNSPNNFGNIGPGSNTNNQQGSNSYPFNPNNGNNFGNVGNGNNNQPGNNKYPFNQNPINNLGSQQPQQQPQTFGNGFQQYPNFPQFPYQTFNPTQSPQIDRINNPPQPNFPNFPFQTISPTQFPQIDRAYNPPTNPNIYQKPKIPLPRIRVIEFPSSEYFEYGGGKLVQPKRPNADLYVGGNDADVPITSKIFIECTGPNQVEWIHNGTIQRKDLSIVTKNIQITIPEERGPNPGSGEYTYLRLGLEEQISERDSGVFICRDRILPQNYISIRILVASTSNNGNTVYTIPEHTTTTQQPLLPFAFPPQHNLFGFGAHGVGSGISLYPSFTFGFDAPPVPVPVSGNTQGQGSVLPQSNPLDYFDSFSYPFGFPPPLPLDNNNELDNRSPVVSTFGTAADGVFNTNRNQAMTTFSADNNALVNGNQAMFTFSTDSPASHAQFSQASSQISGDASHSSATPSYGVCLSLNLLCIPLITYVS